MADIELDAAAKASKQAHWAAVLALIAVGVAVLVLVIDQTIKNEVLAEAEGARRTLAEFRDLVAKHKEGVNPDGTTAAGETRGTASPSVNGAGGLVDDATARKVLAETPDASAAPPAKRRPGRPRRVQGDG